MPISSRIFFQNLTISLRAKNHTIQNLIYINVTGARKNIQVIYYSEFSINFSHFPRKENKEIITKQEER